MAADNDGTPVSPELLSALEWLEAGVHAVGLHLRQAGDAPDAQLRELALRQAQAAKDHVARLLAWWHVRDAGLADALEAALTDAGTAPPEDDVAEDAEDGTGASALEDAEQKEEAAGAHPEALPPRYEPLMSSPVEVPTPAPVPAPVPVPIPVLPRPAAPAPVPHAAPAAAHPAATNATLGRTFGPFKIRG